MNLEDALAQLTIHNSQFKTRTNATLKNQEEIMQSQATSIKKLRDADRPNCKYVE